MAAGGGGGSGGAAGPFVDGGGGARWRGGWRTPRPCAAGGRGALPSPRGRRGEGGRPSGLRPGAAPRASGPPKQTRVPKAFPDFLVLTKKKIIIIGREPAGGRGCEGRR